jgi:peptidoglycan hydrolase-like protein with peptidoglycan-binding domain
MALELINLATTVYPGLLAVGSSGDVIKQIQQCFNVISTQYTEIEQLIEDGFFGYATERAVTAFQKHVGLAPDGLIGPATWAALMRSCVSTPLPQTEVYPGTPLSSGARGDAVSLIQAALESVAKRYPSITPALANGFFGPATVNAVTTFQRQFGLPANGIVDEITWNRIMTEAAGETPAKTTSPVYPGKLLSQGSSGSDVRKIQECLNNIARNRPTDQLLQLTADGIFGPATRETVRRFQGLFNLKQDGIVGSSTWNAIMQACTEQPTASRGSRMIRSLGKPAATRNNSAELLPLMLLMLLIRIPIERIDKIFQFPPRIMGGIEEFHLNI